MFNEASVTPHVTRWRVLGYLGWFEWWRGETRPWSVSSCILVYCPGAFRAWRSKVQYHAGMQTATLPSSFCSVNDATAPLVTSQAIMRTGIFYEDRGISIGAETGLEDRQRRNRGSIAMSARCSPGDCAFHSLQSGAEIKIARRRNSAHPMRRHDVLFN